MATKGHAPASRGYDSWLGYWHHANNYWSFGEGSCPSENNSSLQLDSRVFEQGTMIRDLWRYDRSLSKNTSNDVHSIDDIGAPAVDLQNQNFCRQSKQKDNNFSCVYEEQIILDRVLEIIHSHGKHIRSVTRSLNSTNLTGLNSGKHVVLQNNTPLFLLWSSHLVHMPLEAPTSYIDQFRHVNSTRRRMMRAMTKFLDDAIGLVVQALKDEEMYDDTLIVAHADNGGEIMFAGLCGGNNWPLRGGEDLVLYHVSLD